MFEKTEVWASILGSLATVATACAGLYLYILRQRQRKEDKNGVV